MLGGETYLVLEVDRRIEVRDLGVGGLNHHLALAGVDELAHLEDGGRRAHVTLLEPATCCISAVSFYAIHRPTGDSCSPPPRPPPNPPPPKPPRPRGAPLNDIATGFPPWELC